MDKSTGVYIIYFSFSLSKARKVGRVIGDKIPLRDVT